MIYIEAFFLGMFIFVLGWYLGIKVSVRLLNKNYFLRLVDQANLQVIRQTASMRIMLEDYVSKAALVQPQYPPSNSTDINEHIKRKINLN